MFKCSWELEHLVDAVEGDNDQAAVDAFDLVGAEGLVGDDGAGVDLGGIDACFGLDGGGRHRGLGRDVGGPICIADGGPAGWKISTFPFFREGCAPAAGWTIGGRAVSSFFAGRRGSVSAKSGEKLLIPINVRDGSLICTGKGNEDWNCYAPHGAGRLMSRKQAAATLFMDEYRSEMEGIYTTCVVQDTIDESPMAYKSLEEIVSQIGPTAEIVERIRPIYNFKASE